MMLNIYYVNLTIFMEVIFTFKQIVLKIVMVHNIHVIVLIRYENLLLKANTSNTNV